MLTHHGTFEVDDDRDRIDTEAAWTFLSSEAYWQRWRTRAEVEEQISGAWRLVGAYDSQTGAMVGFARALGDGVAFAYLADLYVVTEARGRGLGVALVRAMIDEGPGADFRWSLHTSDAHDLYRRFGFREPDSLAFERPARGRRAIGGPDVAADAGATDPSASTEPRERDAPASSRAAPPVLSVDEVALQTTLKHLRKEHARAHFSAGDGPGVDAGGEIYGLDRLVERALTEWDQAGTLAPESTGVLKQGLADLNALLTQLTRRREATYAARLRDMADCLVRLAAAAETSPSDEDSSVRIDLSAVERSAATSA